MDERERVRRAIEGPVGEAVRLLNESPTADVQTRLTILINGWGRGLAAGLEELAVAVRDLRRSPATDAEISSSEPDAQPSSAGSSPASEKSEHREAQELSEADEGQLRAQAERSREATAALREEASSDRDDAPSEA